MSLVSGGPAAAAHGHFVRFYDHDSTLVGEVATYLRNGLETGAAALMIATPEHLREVRAKWQADDFDPAACEAQGQLLMLDARATLDRFMVDGRPDPALFEESVGGMVSRAAARFDDVVAFGEMVAVLWKDDKTRAALELEELWNRLGHRHRFSLFCAYPMDACERGDVAEDFRLVCDAHAYVVQDQQLPGGCSEVEQGRMIAELRQKTAALENELAARRHAEAALAQRERDMADFLENAVMGLHRVGPDGTILWANRAELTMLGYEAHEYIGRNIAEFHADRALLGTIMETLAAGGELHEQPATMLCKDGSVRRVLVSSSGRIEDGRFMSTRCFTHDVTERWQAQEALRERSAILHLALEAARMGFWTGDLQTRTLRLSAQLCALLGTEPDELPIDAFVALMHTEDRDGFRMAMEEAVASRTMLRCPFRIAQHPGRCRRFEARGEAVYDEDGTPVRFYGVCAELPSVA
ncbi:MAG TPA: PAS domain S-box protein [Usitatibacter sp.]|nr:PAS domain S-box protein [Usitatibacter sp.]